MIQLSLFLSLPLFAPPREARPRRQPPRVRTGAGQLLLDLSALLPLLPRPAEREPLYQCDACKRPYTDKRSHDIHAAHCPWRRRYPDG